MSSVKAIAKKQRRKVVFSCEAADAHEVILVGTFNSWNPRKHPMQKTDAGAWRRSVMLPPGSYEYKFLIDGPWQEDHQNNQRLPNTFGTHNSVLHVATK